MNATPDIPPDQETLEVVLFYAGGYRTGFEASLVRATRPAASESTDTPIEDLLGLAPSAHGRPRQSVQLKRADEDRHILVERPVDLTRLPPSAIHPLPPLLSARCKLNGLRALALEPDAASVILLIDAESFS